MCIRDRLKTELRRNTYDAASGSISLSADRAAAVAQVAKHYADLFGGEPALDALREQYAMPANILRDAANRQDLTAFFFWSAWSAVTDRPGESNLSYTSNWPHEPLVGNTPTTGTGIWSIASVILMLGAIAAMIFFHSTSPVSYTHLPLLSSAGGVASDGDATGRTENLPCTSPSTLTMHYAY